jgi:hypothetical protein
LPDPFMLVRADLFDRLICADTWAGGSI